MKLRVAKRKSSIKENKTAFPFQNADRKVEMKNKENVHEQSEEDTDLILDEFEENTESDEEGEEIVEDQGNVTKVNFSN